ncbi:MAG: hypothetical protein QMC05_01085, partial [Pseudomonadales bacterium]
KTVFIETLKTVFLETLKTVFIEKFKTVFIGSFKTVSRSVPSQRFIGIRQSGSLACAGSFSLIKSCR